VLFQAEFAKDLLVRTVLMEDSVMMAASKVRGEK
jgi:hypothetical protein